MLNALRIIAMLAAGAAALFPNQADACQCSPEPLYRTIPKAGALDVPLDIAPVLEGAFDPKTLKLMDDMGGAVEFTLAQGPRVACLGAWAEVLPKQPLAPNTRYTIQANALYPDALSLDQRVASLSFTTGESELPDEPLAQPQLKAASVMRGAPDCGGVPTNMVCLGGVSPEKRDHVELLMRRGDEVVMRTTSFVQDDGNYALDKVPDCVELRRRASDGRRSEPVKICGDELPVSDFMSSDVNESGWVTCRDGLIGAAADRLATDAGAPGLDADEDAGIGNDSAALRDAAAVADSAAPNEADAAAPRPVPEADSGSDAKATFTGCAVSADAPLSAADVWLLLTMALPLAATKRRRATTLR